ncbi:MAG TPA: glycosyltransferase family 4 protein [Thermoleophilaceae bacterium]|nr:glycosyltransferase family 4 protein [Thermoleophilaceae bacterium]
MRVLIFHGYLLRGTGSNVYNASLAAALVRLGHEVHLFCQDRRAEELDFVDGERCAVYRPDIHGLLPVYVADRYDGFEAMPFPELSEEQLERYLEANVAAVRELAARVEPEVALANHLVMGPVILARGLEGAVPYAVKIHGSALEYVVRPHRERFLPYALEGLRGASGVLVGSRHTAESLWEVTGERGLPERTRLGPPGVDVHSFRPRPPDEAAAGLDELARRLEDAPAEWGGEASAPEALRELDPRRDRLVAYVGKLIVSKGVDLLLAAWPLVLARVPDARLVVVGFGEYGDALRRLVSALSDGDLAMARDIAARGRELEGGPAGELRYLAAFLDGLEGERREAYLASASGLDHRVHFTGRLEHEQLPGLLSACEALVMPSTFPEAFGMVAAEAAACGALPVSAAHSGMAEVTATLAPAVEEDIRPLLSFELGPGMVEDIGSRLVAWLEAEPGRRECARTSLARLARERYGWEGVAEGVVKAALGRLGELPEVPSPAPPSGPASG